MINQQLIDYIKQSRQAGIEDNATRQALLGSSYSAQDIEEGFNQTVSGQGLSSKPKFSFKLPKKLFTILTIVIIIVVSIVGGYFALAKYFPQYAKYVQPYLGPVLDPILGIESLTEPSQNNISEPKATNSPLANNSNEEKNTNTSNQIGDDDVSLIYTKNDGVYGYNLKTNQEVLIQAGSFDWTLLRSGGAEEFKVSKSPDLKKIAIVRERNGVWIFTAGDKPQFYEVLDTPQGLPFITSVFFSDDSNVVNSYHYEENQYDETTWQKMEDGFYVTITNLTSKENKNLLAVPKKEFPNIDKVLSKPGLCGVSNFLYYDQSQSNLYILLTANTSIMCDVAIYNTKTKAVKRLDIPKDVYLQDYRFHIGKTLSPFISAFVAHGDLPLNTLAAVNVKNNQIVKINLSDEEKKMSMLGRIIWKSDNELVYSYTEAVQGDNFTLIIKDRNLLSGNTTNLASVPSSQLEDVLPTGSLLLKSYKEGQLYVFGPNGQKKDLSASKVNTYIGWVKN